MQESQKWKLEEWGLSVANRINEKQRTDPQKKEGRGCMLTEIVAIGFVLKTSLKKVCWIGNDESAHQNKKERRGLPQMCVHAEWHCVTSFRTRKKEGASRICVNEF
mmetsp:Transcript_13218/g.26063  ORF Transcript_13218/g.26063 Transcript_13218/m.26063 type:complete len:106 (+) Transcript_13218:1098-1415(+)